MKSSKFTSGQRVRLSAYGEKCRISRRVRRGRVVSVSSRDPRLVLILRDGQNTPVTFHESFWEHDHDWKPEPDVVTVQIPRSLGIDEGEVEGLLDEALVARGIAGSRPIGTAPDSSTKTFIWRGKVRRW